MPNPKRKFSKTRRDKRRGQIKLEVRPFMIDRESGEPTLYHRVSLESGFYRGKQVMKGRLD